MGKLTSEEIEELDMEFFLDREGIAHKIGRGSSGLQANIQTCPCCGDNRYRAYFGLDSGFGNCLAGDTEILTREYGAVEIERVSGQTVTLLDGNGEWVACVIHDHGIQETIELSFNGLRGSTPIRSTADHGWIDTKGQVVLTKDLVMGRTRIADLRHDRVVRDQNAYEDGVIHGLFYGDGSKDTGGTFRLRLCSHHDSLAPYLGRLSFTEIKGDPLYYMPRRMAWCEMKELPAQPGKCLDYLLGFLRGWFAADGCVSKQPNATICVGPEEETWLRQWAPLVGWSLLRSTKLNSRTNYGKRIKESRNLGIATQSLTAEDFLIEQHRERWMARPHTPAKVWTPKRSWMPDVRRYASAAARRMERVYCPYVPTTNSFALACGAHSRNCFICNATWTKTKFIHDYFEHDDTEWRKTFEAIEEILKDQGWRPKRQAMVATTVETVTLPNSVPVSDETPAARDYLAQRSIPLDVASYFQLRYCEHGWWIFKNEEETKTQNFAERIVVPVFDLDGTLQTFQGRDMTGLSEKKYLFPVGLPGTGRFVLNAHNCVATRHACMGEGIFDVVAIKMALDEDPELRHVTALGSFGKHLSYGSVDGNDQLGRFATLKMRGLETVTIMWDGEPKALEAALDAARKLVSIGLNVRIAFLPVGKDPNEVTSDVVKAAYRAAKPYTATLDMTLRLMNPYNMPSLRKSYGIV